MFNDTIRLSHFFCSVLGNIYFYLLTYVLIYPVVIWFIYSITVANKITKYSKQKWR